MPPPHSLSIHALTKDQYNITPPFLSLELSKPYFRVLCTRRVNPNIDFPLQTLEGSRWLPSADWGYLAVRRRRDGGVARTPRARVYGGC